MSGRGRGARLGVAVLLAALGFVPVAVVAGAALASRLCAAQADVGGGWLRMNAPVFSAGTADLTSYDVDPNDGRRLLATNGVQVQQSTDSGCSWRAVFGLGQLPSEALPASSAIATVLQTLVDPAAPTHLYVLIGDAGHLDVAMSTDDGRNWNVPSRGLVPAATAEAPNAELVAAPGQADTLFLVARATDTSKLPVVGSTAPGDSVVFVTHDGGSSWSALLLPTATLGTAVGSTVDVTDLAVDPGDARRLWLTTTSGLFDSADGGSNWSVVNVGGSDALSIVRIGASRPREIAVFDAHQPLAYLSFDAGANWTAVGTPNLGHSAAAGSQSGDVAMEDAQAVFAYQTSSATWVSVWKRTPLLSSLEATTVNGGAAFDACSCGDKPEALWRYTGSILNAGASASPSPSASSSASPTTCMPSRPAPLTGRTWGSSALTPAASQVVLADGQSATVPMVLHVAPRVLNVFYLVDGGTHMEYGMCPFMYGALATTRALAQERNLHVGLGLFQDYASSGINTVGNVGLASYVYQRKTELAPVGSTFLNAITDLSGNSNSGNDYAGLEGIYQAATGVGQRITGTAGTLTTAVTGGQQAGFAPSAYNVLLQVTGVYDETPRRQSGYPGVDFGPAINAMKAHQIHALGIWVNNSLNKNAINSGPDGRADLHSLASATGAVSPTAIDCLNAGTPQIRPGNPLVCDYFAGGDAYTSDPLVGSEMTKLLRVLRDPEPVRLRVLSGAASVSKIGPAVDAGVDWLQPSTHPFTVTVHCGAGDTGQTRLIQLGGTVGSTVVAQAGIDLTCGAPVPPAIHLPAVVVPPPPPPPAPNPLPNPGPAPAANPAPNPAPNPAQAPQAQAQSIAQPAVVPQQQKEPQLSFAYASNQVATETGADNPMVAFSAPARRRPWEPGGPAALVGCAIGLLVGSRLGLARVTARRRR